MDGMLDMSSTESSGFNASHSLYALVNAYTLGLCGVKEPEVWSSINYSGSNYKLPSAASQILHSFSSLKLPPHQQLGWAKYFIYLYMHLSEVGCHWERQLTCLKTLTGNSVQFLEHFHRMWWWEGSCQPEMYKNWEILEQLNKIII